MPQNFNEFDFDDREQDHTEGVVARTIENETAKLPSDVFLWSAIGAMGLSLVSHCAGRRHTGLFFGQWAAPLLLMGVYNKIVKVAGNDQATSGESTMRGSKNSSRRGQASTNSLPQEQNRRQFQTSQQSQNSSASGMPERSDIKDEI